MQVQLISGHAVDLGDHPGPVQFEQGADQRAEPQELIARARQQVDGGAARPVAAQPGSRERFPRSPAGLVQERERGLGGSDRLQPGKGLLGDGDLDLVEHRLVGGGQPRPGQVPRRGPGCLRCGTKGADRCHDGRPGHGDLPQHRRAGSAGHQVRDDLRPVQAGDLLGDVPGIQHLRRPSVRVAVPGAQVQHGQEEQGQLVRRGAAAGVDDLQQPSRDSSRPR